MTLQEAIIAARLYLDSPPAGPLSELARRQNLVTRIQTELPQAQWPALAQALRAGHVRAAHNCPCEPTLLSLARWLEKERARALKARRAA